MAANTFARFVAVPNNEWVCDITAADTDADITAGTSYLIGTAGADGDWVSHVRIKPAPGNNTAATVARLWINNGSSLAVVANSVLFAEIGIGATTASNVNPTPDFTIPCGFALNPGHKLYLTLGTAPGGSGEFSACAFKGSY